MRPSEHSRGYLPTLDGWRAIAIAGVLMVHAEIPHWMHLEPLQQKGAFGVNLFFAISGFLICSRLLGEEAVRGHISLRNFYIRRVFRILPAALVFLLTIALLAALHLIPLQKRSWFGALFCFRNYLNYIQGGAPRRMWFTAHFWSLSVEEHFYLILSLVLAFVPAHRKLALILLAVASSVWLAWFLYGPPNGYTIPLWPQRTEFALPALILPSLYALWLESPRVRAAALKYISVLVGIVCALIAMQLCSMPLPHPLIQLQPVSLAVLLPAAIISTVLHPRNWISRCLEWRPLRFVGRISYSLYLWYPLFLPGGRVFSGPIHYIQGQIVGLAGAFAMAVASYFLIEKPMIRLGQRLTGQRTAVPARQPIPPVAEPV